MATVEMGGNLQKDISGSEQERKEPGLELVKGEELDGVVDVVKDLAGKMERDGEVIGEDVLKLDEALKQVKINIGGEIMTVDEVKRIPGLKKNMKIWEEIRRMDVSGDISLTFITPDLVSLLLENYEKVDPQQNHYINLSGLAEISEAVAQRIVDTSVSLDSGRKILLDGLKLISDRSLKILCSANGKKFNISLQGLETLSDEAMEFLYPIYDRGNISISKELYIKMYDRVKVKKHKK